MNGNGYYNRQGPYNNNPNIITNNTNNGSGSGSPGGGGSSGGLGSGGSGGGMPGGGSSGGSMSAPSTTVHPNAGPRDPDGGGRSINAIKNPIN